MRSSRVSVWAVGLLLGASGCAGVQQRGPGAVAVAAPDGSAAVAAAPGGLRGWWSRRVASRYSTTAYSEAEAAPPASPFPADAGGGWGNVFRFSRPPWIARQPQRAAILGAAPSQPTPTPAEINRAIARMTAGRRDDDQVLPVRNVDSREEQAAAPAGSVRLPDALADAPLDDEPVDPEAAEPSPSVPPTGAVLLGIKAVDDPDAAPADVAEPAETDPKVAIAVEESVERPAVTSPALEALEAASREIHDDALVRSSQLPPPPPIRPEPGAQAPPDSSTPKDAPKPDAPAETPKPVDAPILEPAETPKVEEASKPVEPPKVEEASKPVEPPKVEEASKPVEPPKVEEASKPVEPSPPPPPAAEPGERGLFRESEPAPRALAPQWPPWEPTPTAQAQTYTAPVATSFAAPAPVSKPCRWWRWNWKSGGGGRVVTATPQAPATLPPASFPTSYESVWARPLVPSPQAAPVFASPQVETTAGKAPCWLVERLKLRVTQVKAWKEEHVCRHLRDFKAALKGERCEACRHAVTASPQAAPSPQTFSSPQTAPSPQGLPVIGGSRFGMY